jgi:hypothetical protein
VPASLHLPSGSNKLTNLHGGVYDADVIGLRRACGITKYLGFLCHQPRHGYGQMCRVAGDKPSGCACAPQWIGFDFPTGHHFIGTLLHIPASRLLINALEGS